jgi:hypothetical protein
MPGKTWPGWINREGIFKKIVPTGFKAKNAPVAGSIGEIVYQNRKSETMLGKP